MRAFSPTAIQRRILKFFQEHPQAVESVRGIATWLGVEPMPVEEALNGLAEQKWLAKHETSAVQGFALTEDRRLLSRLDQLLGAS